MNEMKFEDLKVGMKVKIRDDLVIEKDYGDLDISDEMKYYLGKEVTIKKITRDYFEVLELDLDGNAHWLFSLEMINQTQIKSTPDLKVKFARMNESVIIPSKNLEDAGFDLYANFEQESIVINQNEVVAIPTGLKSAYSHTHMVMVKERGSTGFIAMSTKAGIFDSGFRNEWKVLINNTNTKPILITKETNESTLEILKDDYIIYPYSKAIAQFLFLPVPVIEIEVVDESEIDSIPSIRGKGMLGSSNK